MRSSTKSLIYVFFAPIVCIIICSLFYAANYAMMLTVCVNDSWKQGYNNLFYGLPISNITCSISNEIEGDTSDAHQTQIIFLTFMGMIAVFVAILFIASYIYIQTIYLALVYHFSKESSERTASFIECFKFKKYALNIVYIENKIMSLVVVIVGAIGYILTCVFVKNTDPVMYTITGNYTITVAVFAARAIYDFSREYNTRQYGSLHSTQEIISDIPLVNNQEQKVDTTQAHI